MQPFVADLDLILKEFSSTVSTAYSVWDSCHHMKKVNQKCKQRWKKADFVKPRLFSDVPSNGTTPTETE